MNPELSDAIASSWNLPFWATASLLLTAWIYLRGWRAARRTREQELPPWRAACFVAGLISVWLAIASPLDVLGSWLLLAHMAQHLVLMSVAPPLLLLGAPAVPLLRGLPRRWVREALGPLLASRPLHALGRFLTHPATGWLAMNVAYLGWHVPVAYELALRSPAWHQAEHACFLTTSLLFWWTVAQPWPSRARWSAWAVIPYLISADLVNTGLSAFLAFSGRVIYPTYATVPRIFAISAAQDQAAAGAFMWVVGSAIYLVPAIAVTMTLLSRRPRRHALVTIGGAAAPGTLGVQTVPFDLLRVPIAGALLRTRYGRQSLQAVSLLAMSAVVAHGLFGHPMAAMNLAGVLPWNFVRAVGVLALIFAGNLFCMACPFTLPRELARRFGWARLRWPRWLRIKWLGVALMLAFFFSYERFALWDNPARTAWLLIAYIGSAFLVDSLFQGASFCKYVCPIGQFNFVGSLLSPTTLRVKSEATCDACTTHDCIRGSATQRGCELELYLPQKHSNADCTLCMDCVKACPHDNIGLLSRSISDDLLPGRVTSSLGRLDRRIDVAAVALVLVFAGLANIAVMVEPGMHMHMSLARRLPWLASIRGSLELMCMIALLVMLIVYGAAAMGRGANKSTPLRESFCRSSLALVPLGMGMWAAHLLVHLAAAIPSLLPLLEQAAWDFGLYGLGDANWSVAANMQGSWLLQAQLLLLDAGLLFSLYLAWRGTASSSRRVIVTAPLGLLMIAVYALAFWLLLAPMQMRGVMPMGAM